VSALWEATAELAACLGESQRLLLVRDTLVSCRRGYTGGRTEPLAMVVTRGNWIYESEVLRFADLARWDPSFADVRQDSSKASFLDAAGAIQAGGSLLVEWIRSRIAGYPLLHVPHLGAGSPRVELSLDRRWPWPKALRGRGLQLSNPPPNIPAAFDVDAESCLSPIRRLGFALTQEPPIVTFQSMRSSLDQSERDELAALSRAFVGRATGAALDSIEPRLQMRRDDHRRALLREAVEGASPSVRAYCEAFEAADDLIDDIMAALTYLAVWGAPLSPRAVLSMRRGSVRDVQMSCRDDRLLFLPLKVLVQPPRCLEFTEPFVVLGYRGGDSGGELHGRRLVGAGDGAFPLAITDDRVPWLEPIDPPGRRNAATRARS
jgi:hypothetical protein